MPGLLQSVRHNLEYLLLRTVQFLLLLLPRPVGLYLGELVGMLLYRLGVYRSVVKTNLDHVALWDHQECERITKQLYRNIGRYAVDFLRPARPLPRHSIHNFEKFEPLLARGRGTIAILGHLGNWEMLATVFGELTGRLHVVARNMNNSIVDKWLFEKRTASGVSTIYSQQALRKMLEVLKKNGIIAILIDQYARRHGTPVPLLGKVASTVRTVAGIVRKTGCDVLSTTAIMEADGSYTISLSIVPEPDLAGMSDDECIAAYQKQHNDLLSEQIRTYPEHWFGWFHRRFRGYADYRRR